MGKLVCREDTILPNKDPLRARLALIEGTGPMTFESQLFAPSMPSALLEVEVRLVVWVSFLTLGSFSTFSLREPGGDRATGL
jgi:hypothetical protein